MLALRRARLSPALLALLLPAMTAVADDAAPTTSPTDLYAMTPDEFDRTDVARRTLDLGAIDQPALAAAIFQETNRARAANGLPPLRHEPKLDQSALLHATHMAEGNYLAHEEPDPKTHTPMDRVRLIGLDPTYVAENVATTFALQYQSGKPFYKIDDGHGHTVPAASPDGPPLPPHTYGSFAKALLDEWMHSPGHRANILSKEPASLGTAAVPATKQSDVPMLYAVQNFAAP